MHIPDDCETAMAELMFRSCCLLSNVDYGDIWLYVPTLHKVVFKLSNQHYQQDYLVLINHLDRDLFLLEVISLELSLDFTYLRQVLIQLPSRFWIFSDLIHLFSVFSNKIESDSRFRKVSIENIMLTRIYFTEFQRNKTSVRFRADRAHFLLGYDVYMLNSILGYKTTEHFLKRIWNSKHQIFSEKKCSSSHCIRYGSICL